MDDGRILTHRAPRAITYTKLRAFARNFHFACLSDAQTAIVRLDCALLYLIMESVAPWIGRGAVISKATMNGSASDWPASKRPLIVTSGLF